MKFFLTFIVLLSLLTTCVVQYFLIINGFTLSPDKTTVEFGEEISITVNLTYDKEDAGLSYAWIASSGTIEDPTLKTIVWTAPYEETEVTITVTVADAEQGNEESESLTLDVIFPQDPVMFSEYSAIETNWATDWEYFSIAGEHYLAVANHLNSSTYNTQSHIYKWDPDIQDFSLFLSIDTSGATGWEHFTLDNDHFLAVANYRNVTTHSVNSTIYKWDTSLEIFHFIQNIGTNGARDWKYFTIDGNHFLTVANNRTDSSYRTSSYIYIWDDETQSFTTLQAITTNGARDWEYFNIDGEHFLALANNNNDSSNNIDSYIYKWDTNDQVFNPHQSISTNGATDMEYFTINGQHYLAVANCYNDITHNIFSRIYNWDSETNEFKEIQNISTNGAMDWKFFTIRGNNFLVVANYENGLSRNIESRIYIWDYGTNEFSPYQALETIGAFDWEYFTIDFLHYLVVANRHNGSTGNITSTIFRSE